VSGRGGRPPGRAEPIRLYWWPEENFGDQLSPRIVETLGGRPVERAEPETSDLVACGSIIEQLHDTGFAGTVWGAGLINVPPDVPIRIPDARVAAVRGHLTRRRLGLPDDLPVGDPGLLCDALLDRSPERVYELGIIPHKVDRGAPTVHALARRASTVQVIDVRAGVDEVLERIAACRAVLSSALHGMIAADALGVPNAWLELSGDVIGAGFKFRDHLSVFGLEHLEPVRLEPGADPETLATAVEGHERPGLETVRQRLREAFPAGDP
jgi:pyruvyltransferase